MDVEKDFAEDRMGAYEAQKTAHWISQGPVIFQVARFMVKSGLLTAALRSPGTFRIVPDYGNTALQGRQVLLFQGRLVPSER